ncbi:peptidoglycan recognition protein 1-like isoform 1-T1 [Discoglossus pictus]
MQVFVYIRELYIMIRLVTVLSALCVVVHCCPTIITRSKWGGKIINCNKKLSTPVKMVIIHHTEGAACTSQAKCSAQARNIQNYHIKTNGWCDIGYNFLIGEDGRVYEGRGWNTIGAHALQYNPMSIGISFFGTFTNRNPNSAAQNAAKSLISCGVSKGYIKPGYVLNGHRDVIATDCPGNTLYKTIKSWPNYKP